MKKYSFFPRTRRFHTRDHLLVQLFHFDQRDTLARGARDPRTGVWRFLNRSLGKFLLVEATGGWEA